MRYALVNGEKVEAQPKDKGICPHCQTEMFAKCGQVKVWHWAHKGSLLCDPWWESETEWHRQWKNKFPKEWQEVSIVDPTTGEHHIADVKNQFGLVIEFQHSIIKSEERVSREDFYKQMVWVVDGTSGDLDESYFYMGLSGPLQKSPLTYQVTWWGHGRLLTNWSESKVRVYPDFGKDVLWRLLFFDPKKKVGPAGPLPKKAFIEDCMKDTEISVAALPYEEQSDEDSHNN